MRALWAGSVYDTDSFFFNSTFDDTFAWIYVIFVHTKHSQDLLALHLSLWCSRS